MIVGGNVGRPLKYGNGFILVSTSILAPYGKMIVIKKDGKYVGNFFKKKAKFKYKRAVVVGLYCKY